MPSTDVVGPCEELVRALYPPFWDEKLRRATPSAFCQSDVSVSRLAILPHDEIVRIFRADLEHRMSDGNVRRIEATAVLRVDLLKEACKEADKSGRSVEVVADPVEEDDQVRANPAHALIQVRDAETRTVPMKLTRGIANKILEICSIRMLS